MGFVVDADELSVAVVGFVVDVDELTVVVGAGFVAVANAFAGGEFEVAVVGFAADEYAGFGAVVCVGFE